MVNFEVLICPWKEVSIMNQAWHDFMKKSDYKKYQIIIDCNKPYCDDFQRNLMERYQLHYFRLHPIEEELNRYRNHPTIKINK